MMGDCIMEKIRINAFVLHIIAMGFMLCDHLWATIIHGNQWLNDIGRIAFPIFAFMIVEGFFNTHNRKKYALRLFIFALLSEIPFNLMYSSHIFYPFHQNVLWTFLIGLGCMAVIEHVKKQGVLWKTIGASICIVFCGSLLGLLLMVDYLHFGVLTVMVFYFFRGHKWYHGVGQLIGLVYIHACLMDGLEYAITIFHHTLFLPQQALAVLALIPIWLYNGKQGPHSKKIQFCYYSFYPVHMLILALLFMMR